MSKKFEIFSPSELDVNRADIAAAKIISASRQPGISLQEICKELYAFNKSELAGAYPAENSQRQGARDYFALITAASNGNPDARAAYTATAEAFRPINRRLITAIRQAAGAVALGANVMEPRDEEADAFGRLMDGSGLVLMATFGDRDVPEAEHTSVVSTQASLLALARVGIALPGTAVYCAELTRQ
ncbi:MAG: hypothetical protein WAQ24_02870 [Candidatus Saccharimonadales bacterium]